MKHLLVRTREQFNTGLDAIANSTVIAFDIEGNGLELWSNPDTQMVGLAVYTDTDDIARYYPFRHGEGVLEGRASGKRKNERLKHTQEVYYQHIQPDIFNLPLAWLDAFHAVWCEPELHLAHNAIFDLYGLYKEGFPTPDLVEDTVVTASLVNTDWRGNKKRGFCRYTMPDTGEKEMGQRGLKWLSRLFSVPQAGTGEERLVTALNSLSERLRDIDDSCVKLSTIKKYDKACLWMLDPADVSFYACLDVYMTYHLQKKLTKNLQLWDMEKEQQLHREFTTFVAWPMNKHGVRLDIETCQTMDDYAAQEMQRVTDEIHNLTGGRIENPGSPKQVVGYLQAIGYDTNTSAGDYLEKIDNPVGNLVLMYRKPETLRRKTKKWLKVHHNGRLHPKLNVAATASLRWSSSGYSGNWQNVPRDTGQTIDPKRAILPPHEDLMLVSIDFGQLEARIMAYVAEWLLLDGKVTTLTDMIQGGVDFHNHTREMCDIDNLILQGRTVTEWLEHKGYNLNEIDDPDHFFGKKIARHAAKTLNFLCMYGGGGEAVAHNLSILDSEVSYKLVDMWRQAYKSVVNAMEKLQQLAKTFRSTTGDQKGAYQFIRYPLEGLQCVSKFNYYPSYTRNNALKDAANRKVQGTASLITCDSYLRVMQKYGEATFTEDSTGNRVYDFSKGLIVPVNIVHDDDIFALRPDDLHIVPDICDIMTDYDISPLTLAVDVEAALPGESWGSKQEVKDMNVWINSKGMVHG